MERLITCSFQGKSPNICSSLGRHCTVQYGSGGNVSISLSPVAYLLFDYILQSLWDEAKKLCWRFKVSYLSLCLLLLYFCAFAHIFVPLKENFPISYKYH